jgi:hypothetical protein
MRLGNIPSQSWHSTAASHPFQSQRSSFRLFAKPLILGRMILPCAEMGML